LHGDKRAQATEALVSNAANHYQMFSATEAPILLSVRDDACGQSAADARKLFEFFRRSRVDIEESRRPFIV
jgi:hypothetical protein